ncbi:hypothetical protein [Lysinibacillus contaminans]|nr:hypothetical protein [Lysinibacillus contaminans]
MFIKDPDAAQLARVTQACADEKVSYIITNTQYWIYNSANGNSSTTEIRNKYSFRK